MRRARGDFGSGDGFGEGVARALRVDGRSRRPHRTALRAARSLGTAGNPRTLRIAGPAILVTAALAALVWALAFGGGAAPLVIGDPGPFVRWGLPTAKLVVNLAAAGMVGALVTALFALKAGEREFDTALDAASVSAAVFTVAAAATGFLTFLDAFNPDAGRRPGVRRAARPVPGRDRARPHLAAHDDRRRRAHGPRLRGAGVDGDLLVTALLAVAALVPMGTQGHSGAEANHTAAVMALVLHIIAAAVWLGGLLLMVVIRPLVDRRTMAAAIARYSSIALAAFVVVAIAGTVRAAIGVGSWAGLASPYGVIVLVKVVALLVASASSPPITVAA